MHKQTKSDEPRNSQPNHSSDAFILLLQEKSHNNLLFSRLSVAGSLLYP